MGQSYTLTAPEAKLILEEVVQALMAQLSAASICLVNRDYSVIALFVMDGVTPCSANIATLKAKQAAYTGKSTRATRDEISAGKKTAEAVGIPANELIPWAGGMPIYDREGHLLGGIGVSNLSESEDEAVAVAAVFGTGYSVMPPVVNP